MVVCVTAMIVVMIVAITVIVGCTVSATFGLKSCLNLMDACSETLQHFFNHVVGADSERIFANLRRQMAISKMPGESHQLMAIFVPDLR